MSKADRRARKKANRQLRLACEQCGHPAPKGETHDSALSVGVTTWDGLVVVAWCVMCGHEVCS